MDAWLLLTLVIAGVAAGFMGGLLGIGGGLVTIPVLFSLFEVMDVDYAVRMHMAIATSLVVIVVTSLSSVRAHHLRGSVAWDIARVWWYRLALASIFGSMFAVTLRTDSLILAVAALIFALGLKMILPLERYRFRAAPHKSVRGWVAPGFIGFVSAIVGIGGGSLSVPYLTQHDIPAQRSVGTASLLGLFISVAGGAGYLVQKPTIPVPDWSIGYVYMPAAVILAGATAFSAPKGAAVAHKVSHRILSIIFAVFLFFAAARLLIAL